KNGQLLAPRRQLEKAGIGAHFVSAAIEETVSLGLVLVKRGRGRRPNIYALSWLPLFDGSVLERPWAMTAKQQHHMLLNSSHKASNDCQSAVATTPNDCCFATVETAAPSKNHDLTRTGVTVLMSVGGEASAPRPPKLNGAGHHPTGKPLPKYDRTS